MRGAALPGCQHSACRPPQEEVGWPIWQKISRVLPIRSRTVQPAAIPVRAGRRPAAPWAAKPYLTRFQPFLGHQLQNTLLNEKGRPLPAKERKLLPTYRGRLRFHEARSGELGRITPMAMLVSDIDTSCLQDRG